MMKNSVIIIKTSFNVSAPNPQKAETLLYHSLYLINSVRLTFEGEASLNQDYQNIFLPPC